MNHRNLYSGLLLLGLLPFLVNGFLNPILYNYPFLYWVFELLSWVALPILVFTICVRVGDLKLAEIGIRQNIFGEGSTELLIVICVIYALISYFLYSIFLFIGEELFPGEPLFFYQQVVPTEGIFRSIVLIYLALSAALVEELYCRGLFFKISRYFKYSILFYVLASPLLFASLHWEGGIANVFATYLFGLLSALMFLWFKNLWPLIAGHLLTNFIYFG